MATAQLATNLGIIGYMALLDHGAWTAIGLNEVFVVFSSIVVLFGLISYLLLLYYVFLAPMLI